MSPAENSPALLARRAAQFVELSVTDGTGYRYDSYWQRVHLGILPNESEPEVIQRTQAILTHGGDEGQPFTAQRSCAANSLAPSQRETGTAPDPQAATRSPARVALFLASACKAA